MLRAVLVKSAPLVDSNTFLQRRWQLTTAFGFGLIHLFFLEINPG